MRNLYKIACCLIGLLPVGCADHLPDNDTPQEKPVTLEFDMYAADVEPQTKASLGVNNILTPMAEETKFNVYAYSTGNSPEMIGHDIYTVVGDNKATGNLSLYRGNYNVYLISNNTSLIDQPTVGDDGLIRIDNGTDFMYNTLAEITVQPESGGESNMSVPLSTPFTRLGSLINLSVKVSPDSPVAVEAISVKSIKISNLSDPLSYKPGNTDWESLVENRYGGSLTVESFTKETEGTTNPDFKLIGEPAIVLPLDGKEDLVFDINLSITYSPAGTSTTEPFNYSVKTKKALQKGMAYTFEFTLTFFGNLTPGDITLSAFGYSTTDNLETDEIGDK